MHDKTINNVTVPKMSEKAKALFYFIFVDKISEKTKAFLDFIFNIIAVILLVAILLFMEAIRNDGVKIIICCIASYLFSRSIKSFRHYHKMKGK